MDLSLIGAAASAISAAKDIGRAAVGIRDANLIAGELTRMNDQLLTAQEALFRHNSQLLELQQQHFDATRELRELKTVVTERAAYVLAEICTGSWAYAERAARQGEQYPPPYLCQPCYDQGVKAFLRHSPPATGRNSKWQCPVNEKHIIDVIGSAKPMPPLRRGTIGT